MVQVCSKILFGNVEFDFCNEIVVTSTWEKLTDTATIKMPKRFSVSNGNGIVTKEALNKYIKRGEPIIIKCGYDYKYNTLLNGYITQVKNGIPVEIIAEDEMFLLKNKEVKPKQFKGGNLEEILIYCGIEKYDLLGFTSIGNFLIDDACLSVAKVLEKIKDQSKLPVFFRNGVLTVGKAYNPDPKKRKKHFFAVGKNIIDHELEPRNVDTANIRVTAYSILPNGNRIEASVGSKSKAEVELVPFSGIKTTAELEKLAAEYLYKKQYNGLTGSFRAFAEPAVQHGDVVELYDPEDVITGSYFVEEVETTCSTSVGIKQKIKIGAKAS